ncbi:MAG: HEAT repeat domain-containing protein [Chloroflexota bacterium]|nr:HEAT repeat domain-containing protein [Chloroflexota bacterium]
MKWQVRIKANAVVWQLINHNEAFLPVAFLLKPGERPNQSQLQIYWPMSHPQKEQLAAFLGQVVERLREHQIALSVEPSETGRSSTAPRARQHIYRRVARNKQVPLEQRLYAAQVLGESGGAREAAKVLGSIVVTAEEEALVLEALEMLGTFGEAAKPVLWYLDARTTAPERAIAIARQLARATDSQTALLRLERLAQHEQEAVRLAALEAMGELGGSAAPHLKALARRASDPQVRLRAARWLHERGEAPELVKRTLTVLASREHLPEVAQAAVELLGNRGGEGARDALRMVAHQSPSAEARLAAAEIMMREGEMDAARAVLLMLAQGGDDNTAGAALEVLAHVSDTAMQDTERLMNVAALQSVRRRAAEILSQPTQPESAQLAAARVYMALDRPTLARPVLLRLTRSGTKIQTRRWAAQQLALIGEAALEEIRNAFQFIDDPVAGQHLAEALLAHSRLPDDQRRAATWLAEHSNLPRAVEVLANLALSARISGSDAVRATDDLNRYATHWAGAARTLAQLATDSPHPAVRARALDLLLREHPSEIPLAMLVDLAVTGTISAAARYPVMQQLNLLAEPVATRIVSQMATDDIDTDRRWQLLQLMNELPDNAALSAFLQLSTRAPQNRIRYVAAEQLIARRQTKAGYAALATIAINAPDWSLRERALYELAQALPETAELFYSIIDRTRYEDTFHLARELLHVHEPSTITRANRWLDHLLLLWDRWVAKLPLGWLDRLFASPRVNEQQNSKR